MNIRLHQFPDEFQALESFLDESEGELTPEIEELLNGLEMQFKDKVENVCKFRASLTAEAEILEREIERLSLMKKRALEKAKWFEGYILRNMKAIGTAKVETPLFKVSIRKNPVSVLIETPEAIPAEYCTLSLPAMKVAKVEDVPEMLRPLVESAPSKTLIAEALKNKIAVPGARLVQGEKLEIK